MANQGVFIVLEGSDGSGKTTQFRLLTERLKAVGYEVEVFKFPQYESESSYFVRRYLNGDYGPASSVSPYTATLFYALDRYEASGQIRQALDAGKVVVCDRYVGSNMAHQGGKIADQIEQRSFFVWEDSLEHQLLGIPRPTVNIFLKVPVEVSLKLAESDKSRSGRSYINKAKDEHEKDANHLRKSVETYNTLCKLFPNDFKAIECVRNGKLLSIPEINNMIWAAIHPMLPKTKPKPGREVTLSLNEPTAKDKNGQKKGEIEGNLIIDRRLSLRLATLINQSVSTLGDINLNWAGDNYKYLTPHNLGKKLTNKYRHLMDELVAARKDLDQKIKAAQLPKSLSYPTTPLSALLKVRYELPPNDANKLHGFLTHSDMEEASELAKAMGPVPGRHNDQPAQISKIVNDLMSVSFRQTLPTASDPVVLMSAMPRNEFKALIEPFYAQSNLSRGEVES